MSGTFVFVHGTGVRSPGYEALEEVVRAKLVARGPAGVEFRSCDWGNKAGISLDGLEQTLPPPPQTKGTGEDIEWDAEIALWSMLIDDPMFELRLASESTSPSSGVIVNAVLPSQDVSSRLNALDTSKLTLQGTGVDSDSVKAAVAGVARSQELGAAADAAKDGADPDLARAIARAVVATVLATTRSDRQRDSVPLAVDPALRDRLVQELQRAIAPTTKGFGDWIKKRALEFAKRKATAIFRDHRSGLTGLGMPGVGDILYYQRRGSAIAREVRQKLEGATRPIVAVGHSLGGIILVDILSCGDAPTVDLLVTVGSQAPLFYAIDALQNVRRKESQPRPFTPWRNIYNRNDFLSYCAQPLLKDCGDIVDEPVDPGVPFPDSHSAYWHHDAVYDLINEWWPASRPH